MTRKMRLILCPLIAASVMFTFEFTLPAEIRAAPVFGSHMVLQRGMPVPVWGTASSGEKVVVSFEGQEKATQADANGRWSVKLDPLKEGGPYVLKIGTLSFEDVLVGEVWIGAGQSNMVIGSTGMAKDDPVLAEWIKNDYPQVRIGWGGKGDWRAAKAPVSLPALPFSFAVSLHKQLGVPVGVVVGAVPGSSTDFWITPEAVKADEECRAAISKYAESVYPKEKQAYDERLRKWESQDPATRKEKPEPPLEPGAARHPIGKFFDEHIRPMISFAVRGALWDQGENGPSITGTSRLMVTSALISSWRKSWGQGDFPWIFVQKPSGGGCAWDPNSPINRLALPFSQLPEKMTGNGTLREQYVKLLRVPNTFMVITTDLSPGLHPPMKSSYGSRAAEIAMVAAYGGKAEIYGPLYESSSIEGNCVRIKFTHTGKGLEVRHSDKLQGFAVAGEDKRFVWADAKIDGDTVLVSSPAVSSPVAVRYAWDEKCPWANLFNKDGMPAQTFRTDPW